VEVALESWVRLFATRCLALVDAGAEVVPDAKSIEVVVTPSLETRPDRGAL
jgi:hypothetical protein